ncbi:hypothetical protein ACU8V6_13355 [Vibrio alginolyticus]
MEKQHLSASIIALALLGSLAPAHAEDTLKSYTSTLLQLDDGDARSKKNPLNLFFRKCLEPIFATKWR